MQERRFIVQAIMIAIGLIYVIRLFFLQVLDSSYKIEAEINAIEKVVDYPYRGLIYDRHGDLLVFNTPVFDITIVTKEFKLADTALFCTRFGTTPADFKKLMSDIKNPAKNIGYSRNKPQTLFKQLSLEDFAHVQDYMQDYPGLYTQARTVRSYTYASAANALGYIGEIGPKALKAQESSYYKQGDYIGQSGLELYYEKELRGRRGVKYIMKDVHGVLKGKYRGGAYDTISAPGENLISTFDIQLQQYGEKLLQNKIGCVVAIEPQTGEILAFVSSPSYDPNLLTGRKYSANYHELEKDPYKPLFNRPLMAMYPPGSIFKLAQAAVALQEGAITDKTRFPCDKSLVNCHQHPSPQDLRGAIQWSCNPYFYMVFKKMISRDLVQNKFKDTEINYDEWRRNMLTMGFGQKMLVDLPSSKSGNIPSNAYYDKIYGDLHWKFSTIYSLSIGQGEINVVPIQMANLAALIANRGWYITPHFIKSIGKDGHVLEEYKKKHVSSVEPKYFDPIIDGMAQVVLGGTAYWLQVKDIEICGKTGTAENPHGDDHSVYIAFAPKQSPKIAIAVYVENAGFGAMTAAPIAHLMIEKYLKDTITKAPLEKMILEKNLLHKVKIKP
ncbi:peptidoglycan D,D-transpeptidase FtsI family protein [Cytophaga aurantiaca]|uniref:peptidoglycan D,D-transpeptidase FtsI family protein n=1 Tax=Cytophaga aurantiaca TaxID=29530 RepID=UPI000366A48D|nr:penicillin-binding transpeptidase domain-containing protein [Cytophaga aurantiaca]